MKDQKQQIDVEVNSKQAKHLQSLGLRYLLQTAFPKTLMAVWRQAWLNRITVGLVILGVYSITVTVVAVGYKKDLRKLNFADAKTDSVPLALTDSQMLAKVVERIGADGYINKRLGSRGGTILSNSMNKETPIEFVDYLIRNGADLNIKRTIDGSTPLMAAIQRGAFKKAIYLIDNHRDKIDFSIQNDRGQTLHSMALRASKIESTKNKTLKSIVDLTREDNGKNKVAAHKRN